MLNFLTHCYQFAEDYTVVLVWIVVPLGFYSTYLFFQRHYRMFSSNELGGMPQPKVTRAAAEAGVESTPTITEVKETTQTSHG